MIAVWVASTLSEATCNIADGRASDRVESGMCMKQEESCVFSMITHANINADNNKNEAWLEVSKEPQYRLNRRLGGVERAVQPVWTFGRTEKSCTCRNGCIITRSCLYAARTRST
jgi:hypothetical protein